MLRAELKREVSLALPMAALIGLGWVMVFSTGAALGVEGGGGGVFYHLKRQVIATLLGTIALLVAQRTPLERLARLTPRLLLGASLLMLAVFIPGVGRTVARATRWINLGVFSFQPVEVFKPAILAMYAALLAVERPRERWSLETWGRVGALAALSVGLPIIQRDFGSAVLMMSIGGVVIWLAGARVGPLIAFGAAALVAAVLLVASSPYRMHRIVLYLSASGGDRGGYQTQQSLIALGSGGLFGAGLGESTQKLFYLPSAHADFIYAIIGEELGLVGAALTLGAYILLLREGLAIALAAPARFPRLLAAGLSLLVFLQALWHIAVSLVLVPTKGLALPFVSYGGSSMIASMLVIGLIMRCAAESGGGGFSPVRPPAFGGGFAPIRLPEAG